MKKNIEKIKIIQKWVYNNFLFKNLSKNILIYFIFCIKV